MEVQFDEPAQEGTEDIRSNCFARKPARIIRHFERLRNLGTSLGTKPCQTPSETVIHDAWKCKKSQLHSVSGFNSGLEVRVLPGSPTKQKYLQENRYKR